MDKNEILKKFKEAFEEQSGCEISRYLNNRNIINVKGKINCNIYVRVCSNNPNNGFWGITINQINKLKKESLPFFLVLLFKKPDYGYFVTINNIDKLVELKYWKETGGEYKVNGKNDIEKGNFNSLKLLINKIKKELKNKMSSENLNENNSQMKIIEIHSKVLNFLIKKHLNDPDFLFVPRRKNTGKRLEKGYWFLGNDNDYLSVSFWISENIQFPQRNHVFSIIILPDGTTYFEINTSEKYPKLNYLIDKIIEELKHNKYYITRQHKNFYAFDNYEGKDYLNNLNEFITYTKPIIDNIIKTEEPDFLFIPNYDEFIDWLNYLRENKAPVFNSNYIKSQNLTQDEENDLLPKLKKKISVRNAIETIIEYREEKLEKELFALLKKDNLFISNSIKRQQDYIDLIAISKDGTLYLFELKVQTAKQSIRLGLGQLIEYAYHHYQNQKLNPNKSNHKLIIASTGEPDENDKKYINLLKTKFPFEYWWLNENMVLEKL